MCITCDKTDTINGYILSVKPNEKINLKINTYGRYKTISYRYELMARIFFPPSITSPVTAQTAVITALL